MLARFRSRCPSCAATIAKGAEISKRGRRYVCARCASEAGSGARTAYEAGDTSPGALRSHYDRSGLYSSGGQYMGRAGGRCEDAPCCGCCG